MKGILNYTVIIRSGVCLLELLTSGGRELAVTVWDSNQLNYVPAAKTNDLR